MPWEIKESDGKFCVHKAGESDPLKCYSSKGEAEDYMKALYANSPDTHTALIDRYKNVDPNVGGGTDRDKMDEADFAGKDRSFPIKTPADVNDAARSIGRAKNNFSPEQIKKNIIRIAKRKGPAFVAQLPEDWKKELGIGKEKNGALYATVNGAETLIAKWNGSAWEPVNWPFHGSDFLLDDYVATRPGDPFRLFPFGVIVKNGKRREITPEYAATFKLPHFKPPIKLGSHEDPTPAGGHILRLEVRADGLYAIPELNDKGAQAIQDGAYRYQSPEVIWEGSLEDPTTGAPINGPLIVGDALLHTPHLGEAAALYTITPFNLGENKMSEDTVQVPKSLFDVFTSWFKKNAEPPAPACLSLSSQTNTRQRQLSVTNIRRKSRQCRLRPPRKRGLMNMPRTKDTKAEQKPEIVASMTNDQANWVVSQFKALSAQIAGNDVLTKTLGTEKEAPVNEDPQIAIDAQIKQCATRRKSIMQRP